MFLDEDQKGEKRKGKSVIESLKRADAWERIWRSDDGNGLSPSTAGGATETSSQTHRTSERSSRRAPAAVCPIQTSTPRVSLSHMAGGGRRGLIPTVRSSQGAGKGMQRGGERAERAPDGTTLHVGVCSVRQWPGDGESWSGRTGRDQGGVAEPISQAAHLSTGCGPVSGDVEHSQDPPERETSANSGEIPDANARPALPEDAQNINKLTHSPQSSPPSKGDRTGRPGTTDEERAKDTESTRASPQESGGQVHLMEDEIDINETDLAESMAIWGFGKDEHMSLQ